MVETGQKAQEQTGVKTSTGSGRPLATNKAAPGTLWGGFFFWYTLNVKTQKQREGNPFEDKTVAEEWIRSVEGEKGLIRDNEIYPMLREWASKVGKGTIAEIGSGQGVCSQHLGNFKGTYIGIEPSELLVSRAKELYGSDERLHFLVGNAYELPLESESADGAFSVNVWFHLADLETAARELSRILKTGAKFNIITANPENYDQWRSFFHAPIEKGKMLSGKVDVPINPLTRNDFYMHTLSEMTESLKDNGLKDLEIFTLGTTGRVPHALFVSIQGVKE